MKTSLKKLSPLVICAVVFSLILCCLCGCSSKQETATKQSTQQTTSKQSTQQTTTNQNASGTLKAHFIDVGQGDSEFLELPDGKTMLIDAGEWDQADTVKSYIKKLGYSKIDYVVATHPHSDHIGAMADVIKAFDIGEFWAPKVSHNTSTYEKMLDAIADKGLQINTATRGKSIYNAQGCSIEILSPFENTDYDNLNDWSVILKVVFGSDSLLFTGDASSSVIDTAQAGQVNVLKVGHHGSKTSTTNELVSSLSPQWAVIEVGADNDYGHPTKKALNALEKYKVTVYRTDFNGTCVATCDGSSISWTTEKG